MSMNYNDFWVRLYPELEYICFGSLSTSSWLPKSKGNSFSTNSVSSKHLKTIMLAWAQKKNWVAPIFKTSTFEVHKNFSEFFSPSLRWVLPVAGLGLRLPRQNTAALRSRARPRFHGPAAPGGEGGRGCGGRTRPWPRRRIWGRKHREVLGFRFAGKWMKTKCGSGRNVDGSSFLSDIVFRCFQMFSIFVERISQKTLVFFLAVTFSAPLLSQCTDKTCSNDDFSLAIFWSDHCIPKLIKFPAPFNEPWHPDSIDLDSVECVALVTSLWWVILDGCEVNEDVDGLSFLWSWLHPFLHLDSVFEKKDFNVGPFAIEGFL